MPDAIILYVVAPLLKHLPSFLIAMMDVVVAGLQIFAEVVREKNVSCRCIFTAAKKVRNKHGRD